MSGGGGFLVVSLGTAYSTDPCCCIVGAGGTLVGGGFEELFCTS